jgi:Cu-Zn family superoxide dismutase
MKRFSIMITCFLIISSVAWAEEVTVSMFIATDTGPGKAIGTLSVADTSYGALFTPDLHGLTPGLHGFHVHENAVCGPKQKDGKMVPGLAAGGHFDPGGSGRHEGPYGNGHLGDLPPLYIDGNGGSSLPVLAPRLKVADIKGRSLMIHAGGDNFSDHPETLGGGGPRKACGIVQ